MTWWNFRYFTIIISECLKIIQAQPHRTVTWKNFIFVFFSVMFRNCLMNLRCFNHAFFNTISVPNILQRKRNQTSAKFLCSRTVFVVCNPQIYLTTQLWTTLIHKNTRNKPRNFSNTINLLFVIDTKNLHKYLQNTSYYS